MSFNIKEINQMAIIKFAEIVLTSTCVGLHSASFNPTSDVGMLVTGTFVGFLIIFLAAFVGYLIKAPQNKRIDIMLSLVGVALFVASGAVVIDRYQGGRTAFARKNLAKGSLAIINGAVLLADAFLTYRNS